MVPSPRTPTAPSSGGPLFFEGLLEWLVSSVRRDGVRLLKERAMCRVLDLGCGTGGFSRRLAGAGLSPVGLDVSPTLLASIAAKANQPLSFPVVLGDARHIPFKPGFDAGVLSLALHEMDQDSGEAVWAELERLLRPEGLLVLVDYILPGKLEPMGKWGSSFIRFIEYLAGRIHPLHYSNYLALMKREGLTTWVSAHGVSVHEERHYALGNMALLVVGRV